MIFAMNVLAVMLMSRLFGLEALKKLKLLSAVFLTAGGMMQGLGTLQHMEKSAAVSDDPLGCALAVLALLLDASRWVLLQAVFTAEEIQEDRVSDTGHAPLPGEQNVESPAPQK